jgi:hypothetical protein
MAEIDPHVYQEFISAREAAKQAKEWADELAAKIKLAAGTDEELTVGGVRVGTYDYINKFPAKRFIKEHEELAAQFMEYRTVSELNEVLLRRTLPELYRKYQTRQLSIEG